MRPFFFIVPVVVVGWIIGWMNVPGPWYQSLSKPVFNPPNWIFAPVWTALYVMIGIVGWRVWERANDRRLRILWAAQLLLNYAWSPAFFGMEAPGLSLGVISLLLATILTFVFRAAQHDRVSVALLIPYLAWVSFATLLNFEIWRLN